MFANIEQKLHKYEQAHKFCLSSKKEILDPESNSNLRVRVTDGAKLDLKTCAEKRDKQRKRFTLHQLLSRNLFHDLEVVWIASVAETQRSKHQWFLCCW